MYVRIKENLISQTTPSHHCSKRFSLPILECNLSWAQHEPHQPDLLIELVLLAFCKLWQGLSPKILFDPNQTQSDLPNPDKADPTEELNE